MPGKDSCNMAQARTEILNRLHAVISAWKGETGEAHRALTAQIAAANQQLNRLMEVLSGRNDQAVALARAREEILALRRALRDNGLCADEPAESETQGVVNQALNQVETVFVRLQDSLSHWTSEVTDAHEALTQQLSETNSHFESLLGLLSQTPPESPGEAEKLQAILRDKEEMIAGLRKDRDMLSSHLETLNAEWKARRAEQQEALAAEQEKRRAYADRVAELEDRRAAADGEMPAGARQRILELEAGLAAAETALHNREKALAEAYDRLARLENDLIQRFESLTLAAKAEDTDTEAETLREMLEVREAELARREARCAERENRITELEGGEDAGGEDEESVEKLMAPPEIDTLTVHLAEDEERETEGGAAEDSEEDAEALTDFIEGAGEDADTETAESGEEAGEDVDALIDALTAESDTDTAPESHEEIDIDALAGSIAGGEEEPAPAGGGEAEETGEDVDALIEALASESEEAQDGVPPEEESAESPEPAEAGGGSGEQENDEPGEEDVDALIDALTTENGDAGTEEYGAESAGEAPEPDTAAAEKETETARDADEGWQETVPEDADEADARDADYLLDTLFEEGGLETSASGKTAEEKPLQQQRDDLLSHIASLEHRLADKEEQIDMLAARIRELTGAGEPGEAAAEETEEEAPAGMTAGREEKPPAEDEALESLTDHVAMLQEKIMARDEKIENLSMRILEREAQEKPDAAGNPEEHDAAGMAEGPEDADFAGVLESFEEQAARSGAAGEALNSGEALETAENALQDAVRQIAELEAELETARGRIAELEAGTETADDMGSAQALETGGGEVREDAETDAAGADIPSVEELEGLLSSVLSDIVTQQAQRPAVDTVNSEEALCVAEAALDESTHQSAALREELRAAREEIERLQAEAAAPPPEAVSPEQVAELEEALGTANDQVAVLEAERASLQHEKGKLEEQLRKAGERGVDQEKQLEELRETVEELRGAARKKDEEISRLNTALSEAEEAAAAFREENAPLRASAAEQEEAIRFREEELEQIRGELSEKETARAALESMLEEQTGNLEILRKENDRLKIIMEEARERENQAVLERDELAKQLESAGFAREEDARKLAAQEEELAGNRSLLAGYEDNFSALQERIGALEGELEDARRRENAAEATATEMRDALENMRASEEPRLREQEENRRAIQELQADLDKRSAELGRIKGERDELEEALNSLIAQNAEHGREAESMEKDLAELEGRASETGRDLEEARQALDAQKQAIQERDARIETLQAECDGYTRAYAAEAETRQQEMERTVSLMNQAMAERNEAVEALEHLRAEKDRIEGGIGGGIEAAGSGGGRIEARNQRQRVLIADHVRSIEGSRPLGEMLRQAGVIDEDQLQEALREQRNNPDQLLGAVLIRKEYTTEEAIAQAVACQLDIPLVDPAADTIGEEARKLLSREVCAWHVCVPVYITEDRIAAAMANPLDAAAIAKIREQSGREVLPLAATASSILNAIDTLYGLDEA
jgi:chromosome segregation ATPase